MRMSTDALLWVGTLLFCAAMLILASTRRSEADGEAIDYSDHPAFDGVPVDIGEGWSLGGDAD